MPRGAWLALGALGAAVLAVITAGGPWSTPVAVAASATAPVAIALALRQRIRGAAVAVGIASIGLRLVLGGVTAPQMEAPPTHTLEGAWTAQVDQPRFDRWRRAAGRAAGDR